MLYLYECHRHRLEQLNLICTLSMNIKNSLLELKITLSPESLKDIFIAELSALGYESFWEKDEALFAYIHQESFSEGNLEFLREKYPEAFAKGFQIRNTHDQSWAVQHEEVFQSIVVAEQCLIRHPDFETDQKYPYEIIINPQLAFGSGQHTSTALSLELQLTIPHKQKKILDLGCGSGILAVLAEQLGAKSVDAIDNNPWAIKICQETLEHNQAKCISPCEGNINTLSAERLYDIFLANINASVLLKEVSVYPNHLSPGGYLLLAGFLEKDEKEISQLAQEQALSLVKRLEREGWVGLLFQSEKNITSTINF